MRNVTSLPEQLMLLIIRARRSGRLGAQLSDE